MSTFRPETCVTSVLCALALAMPLPAQAQRQADFLFGRPGMTVSVYGGWAAPAEGSDVFDEARSELTVQEGDFASPLGMVELAFRVNERVDLALGVEHAARTVSSEMREWVWADERPIVQTTDFSRTRALVSGKFYLLPRGREISRHAWVPNRLSPYIGGGAGYSRYEFSQTGDFAVPVSDDPLDREIFELEIASDGSGFTPHVLAGAQLSLSPRFLVRGEYRYLWGSGELDSDSFQGFEPIDLSGSNIMVGLTVRM